MGTTEATLRMENMEVKDEWQDEDFPRYDPSTFYRHLIRGHVDVMMKTDCKMKKNPLILL